MTFLFGVNIAGAEFGNTINNGEVVSSHYTHYIHPPLDIIADFAAAGAKVIRYPFKWERVQRYLNGDLSTTELSLMDERVAAITAAGMVCILDMHNYMRRKLDAVTAKEYVMGKPVIDFSHFANVWGKIADRYKNNPLVWFNLMNEPHGVSQEVIYGSQQAAIDAIRATGATNKILVSIDTYSSVRVVITAANMATLQRYVDPANNRAVDLHQYIDNGLQGDDPSVISPAQYEAFFNDATAALESIGWQAVLGEFNVGMEGAMTPEAWAAYNFTMNHLKSNSHVWICCTIWAYAPWWSSNYMFRTFTSSDRFIKMRDIFNLNPTYHFKVDEGVTIVDGKVSQWQDVVAGMIFSQVNTALRPVYDSNEQAIVFQGVGIRLEKSGIIFEQGTSHTILYAAKRIASGSVFNDTVIEQGDDGSNFGVKLTYSPNNAIWYKVVTSNGSNDGVSSTVQPVGQYMVGNNEWNQATNLATIRKDGAQIHSFTRSGTIRGNATVSHIGSRSSWATNVAIKEMLIYDRLLTPEERSYAEAYLAAKCGDTLP